MIDNKTLGNYSYTMGTIIQAMIRWSLYSNLAISINIHEYEEKIEEVWWYFC